MYILRATYASQIPFDQKKSPRDAYYMLHKNPTRTPPHLLLNRRQRTPSIRPSIDLDLILDADTLEGDIVFFAPADSRRCPASISTTGPAPTAAF